MERNREARRGAKAAANGGGGVLSKRKQRNSRSFRDSPEENGRTEMPETSRLRDRAAKKDQDRDRFSRSKRRRGERGERMLHGSGSNGGDESSDDIMEEDEEDKDDDLYVALQPSPSSPPPPNSAVASSPPQQNHQRNHRHHQEQVMLRKRFTPKVVKWKVDGMIGVTVPRKARSVPTRRSHEPVLGGGGEHISRQASISPSRLIPACTTTTQASPSSSNGSLGKKMPISRAKRRPPKISKSTSLIQDEIEIEIAEVLFGMTRQFESRPKQETHKLDARNMDGGSGNEAKSKVSSPSSMPPFLECPSAVLSSHSCSNAASLPTVAPKKKNRRPVKFNEESPTSPVGLDDLSSLSLPSVAKMDSENQTMTEASSPGSENNACPAIKIGGGSIDVFVSQAGLSDLQQQESSKVQDLHPLTGGSDTGDRVENKEELISPAKESARTDLDVDCHETPTRKLMPDSPENKIFKIDLMAPPGKLSPERDDLKDFDSDHKRQGPATEIALKVNKEKTEKKLTVVRDVQQIELSVQKDIDLTKQVVIKQNLDNQLDLEKQKKGDVCINKVQIHRQQAKDPKAEPKQEKSASSLHIPSTVGTWPGSFPPYGCMGQVPSLQAVVPMDGTAGPSNSLQPPPFLQRHPSPKHCATHCFIAQMISNYQKFASTHSLWTAAAGAAPLYGAKPYNHNIVPPLDATLSGNSMQGSFLGANLVASKNTKGTPALTAPYTGHSSQEKMPSASKTVMECSPKNEQILQQMPLSGSANNMPHGAAFIFPVNQQQAAAATDAANRAGAVKSTMGSGALSSAVFSCGAGGSATPMNLNFADMFPNDAHCVAFLQNNTYPFPIPAHISGAPPFEGTSNAQPMPFFYPCHMLHSSQLQPQQQQPVGSPLPHVQPRHQNPSALSRSSSQKHPQQLQCTRGIGSDIVGASSHVFPATKQWQDLLPQQSHYKESKKAIEDDISTADGMISHSHKGICCQKNSMPIHTQDHILTSTAAAAIAMGNGEGHYDNQPLYQQSQNKQNMKVELTSPQAFIIPFSSFGRAGTAPPGLNFSSMPQNHAILQSLPEICMYGYHQMATAAVAATAQAAGQKVHQGKSLSRESMNTNMTVKDRKNMAATKGPQHSLSFVKADSEPPILSILSNNVMGISSQSVNLIQASANSSRSAGHSAGTFTATTAVLTATTNITNSQQQQEHLSHLQKHQQQQPKMQHHLASSQSKALASSNNTNIHPESLPGCSINTKFPHDLTGFPQALPQGSSLIQWPEGKTPVARGVDPTAASPTTVVKNNLLQLQGQATQQSVPSKSHQIQISFGMNSNKVVPPGGQHLSGACGSPSSSSASIAVGSPSNPVSKGAGGSPQASASVKTSPQTSAILLPQQSSAKQSASSCSSKLIPVSNPNMPSILGHPRKVPAPSSNTKQQQQPQQLSKQQPCSQAQLFFSNPHVQPAQCSHFSDLTPTCARQSAQNTSDPPKALAVRNSMKGLPLPSFPKAAQLAVAAQSASGSPHPPISATVLYMSLPPFAIKPSAGQKPAAA